MSLRSADVFIKNQHFWIMNTMYVWGTIVLVCGFASYSYKYLKIVVAKAKADADRLERERLSMIEADRVERKKDEAEKRAKEQSEAAAKLLQQAKKMAQPFHRSRITTLGRFGAGKTSLMNTLLNKPPSERVESTIGMEVSLCEMYLAGIDGNSNFPEENSGKFSESERAVARSIRLSGRSDASKSSSGSSQPSGNGNSPKLKPSGSFFVSGNSDPGNLSSIY